ncbi:hypothetical protein X924_01205 [Petrotoga sp. 9PWA.NaAc.5.4]|nr:hypothetical protein X924_01205 [Petrotoga sp. 9PWA.NaAc.5.4]
MEFNSKTSLLFSFFLTSSALVTDRRPQLL